MKTRTLLLIMTITALKLMWLPAADASGETNVYPKSGSPFESVFLLPGDSRSLEFEYNDTFQESGSGHLALITALSPDHEIHQLIINISPVGDVGPEVGYFTWGALLVFSGDIIRNSIEFMAPKFTYGFKSVTYVIDVNPVMSIGFLFSTALVEYSHFDFPLNMTMTLTLSN